MRKILSAILFLGLVLGMVVGVSAAAEAHAAEFTANCTTGVHVHAHDYDGNVVNKGSVTIGGVTTNFTFGNSYDHDFAVPQSGATTTWSAHTEAADGSYKQDDSGTVGPCGTAPVVHHNSDITAQWTPCNKNTGKHRLEWVISNSSEVTMTATDRLGSVHLANAQFGTQYAIQKENVKAGTYTLSVHEVWADGFEKTISKSATVTGKCAVPVVTTPKTPVKSVQPTQAVLPNTGMSDKDEALGILAILLIAGGSVIIYRSRRA